MPTLNEAAAKNPCQATSKRSGQPCRNPAVAGRTTCRMHGGTVRRGAASPNARPGGRYSRILPEVARELMEKRRDDADVSSQRDVVLLLDHRIEEILARGYGTDGQAAVDVAAIREAFDAVDQAVREGDPAALARGLGRVRGQLERAEALEAAWAKALPVIDTRRRAARAMQLAETASDRVISAEQFDFLLRFVEAAILRHVTEPHVLRALVADLTPVFQGGVPGQA